MADNDYETIKAIFEKADVAVEGELVAGRGGQLVAYNFNTQDPDDPELQGLFVEFEFEEDGSLLNVGAFPIDTDE